MLRGDCERHAAGTRVVAVAFDSDKVLQQMTEHALG